MHEVHALDKLDQAILRELQRDGRQTYDVVGAGVGLSASAVLRRVRRLEEAGVIAGYVALTAYLSVRLEKRCKSTFVLEQVKATTAVPV